MFDSDTGPKDPFDSAAAENVEHLQEIIDELKKENASLHSQFNDAVSIASELEAVQRQNSQLSSELRSVKSENEELHHRLDICSQSTSELSSRLAAEKVSQLQQRDFEQTNLSKEFERQKQQFQLQIDNLYEQLNQSESAREWESIDSKVLNGKVERLLQNASHYHNDHFDRLEDLIDYLSQNPKSDNSPPSPISPQPSPNNLEKKYKRLKSTYSRLHALKQQLEGDLAKMNENLQQQEADYENEIIQLKQDMQSEAKQYQAEISNLKHQISNLQQQNHNLHEENQKNRLKLENPKVIVQTVQAPPIEKIVVDKEAQESAAKQIREMSQQILQIQKSRDEIADQKMALAQKHKQTEEEKQHLTDELKASKVLYKESLEEIKVLRQALHTRSSQKESQAQKSICDAEYQKQRTQMLQKEITEQRESNEKLQKASKELEHENQTQHMKLKDLEFQNGQLESQLKQTREDLFDFQRRFEQIKIEPSLESSIPMTAWRVSELNEKLQQQIIKIAQNSSLQIGTKINKSLSAAADFYLKEIHERDQEIHESGAEHEKFHLIMKNFVVDLSIALQDQVVDLGSFDPHVLIQAAKSLRESNTALNHENEEYSNAFEYFSSLFEDNLKSSSLKEQVDFVHQCFEQQKLNYEQLKRKYEKLKIKAMKLTEEANETTQTLSAQVDQLGSSVDQLEKQLVQTQKCLKSSKQNESELTRLVEEQQTELERANSDYEAAVNELKRKTEEEKQEHQILLQREATKYNQQLQEVTQAKVQLEQQVSRNQKLIQALNDQKKMLEEDLVHSCNQVQEETLLSQFEAERGRIADTYEKTIEQLRSQCEGHRKDVEKMAVVLSEAESKLTECRGVGAQLSREKRRLEKEIEQVKGEMGRERKLLETTTKAKTISIESDARSRIEDEIAKSEEDKRKIFTFVADQFRRFFNPSEKINEKSFKSLVERVGEEVKTLQNESIRIRRMIGASEGQTTEDAVAQLYMKLQ